MTRPKTLLILLLASAALGACAQGPAPMPSMMETGSAYGASGAAAVRIMPVTAQTIALLGAPVTMAPETGGYQYRIGVGDVVQIHAVDAAELTTRTGYRVGPDGMIHVPFLGAVPAQGQTTASLRAEIAQRLRRYISNPQVDVGISEFNARHISVVGEVNQPNRQALTETPLTVIDAINAAGGFTTQATQTSVTLIRNGVPQPVDLAGFLHDGRALPVLIEGDVLRVEHGARNMGLATRRAETVAPAALAEPVARLVTDGGQTRSVDLTAGPISVAQVAPALPAGNVILLRHDGAGIVAHQFTGMDAVAPELGGRALLSAGDVLTVAPPTATPQDMPRHIAAALALLIDR